MPIIIINPSEVEGGGIEPPTSVLETEALDRAKLHRRVVKAPAGDSAQPGELPAPE